MGFSPSDFHIFQVQPAAITTQAVAIALAAELQQLAQGPSPKGLILENTPGQLSGLVGSRVGWMLVGTCLFYCFGLVGCWGLNCLDPAIFLSP